MKATENSEKVTTARLQKYFSVTEKALAKAKPKNGREKEAELILDTAQRYFSDAKHFESKSEIVTAFAALNYAHGWLDAGARLGILETGGDSELFSAE